MLQSVIEIPLEQLRRQQRVGGIDLFLGHPDAFQVVGEQAVVKHFFFGVSRPFLGQHRIGLREVVDRQGVNHALHTQAQDDLDDMPFVVFRVNGVAGEQMIGALDRLVEARQPAFKQGIDFGAEVGGRNRNRERHHGKSPEEGLRKGSNVQSRCGARIRTDDLSDVAAQTVMGI